jgi:pimeloyl-ACP methyl ester carboxylesterase
MATTNRGYILDMVPGQSFVEFLLNRGYDVYMLDWTAPGPVEKSLRMESYVLDFIPDSIRRVQEDCGVEDVTVIGYCFGGVLSLLYGSIFRDGPMKNLICFATPIDFREMKLFSNSLFRRRPPRRQRGQHAAGTDPAILRDVTAGFPYGQSDPVVGKHLERRIRKVLPDVRSLGDRHFAARWRIFSYHGTTSSTMTP